MQNALKSPWLDAEIAFLAIKNFLFVSIYAEKWIFGFLNFADTQKVINIKKSVAKINAREEIKSKVDINCGFKIDSFTVFIMSRCLYRKMR